MNRLEYYREVEKLLKHSIKLPCALEHLSNLTGSPSWYSTLCISPKEDSEFRFSYVVNNTNFYLHEKDFDKYYYPFIDYNNKLEVSYREADIDITVNNIIYAILNTFQKTYLTP